MFQIKTNIIRCDDLYHLSCINLTESASGALFYKTGINGYECVVFTVRTRSFDTIVQTCEKVGLARLCVS